MTQENESGQAAISMADNFEALKEKLDGASVFDFDGAMGCPGGEHSLLVSVPFKTQQLTDEISKKLCAWLDVKELYHAKWGDGSYCEWVAYGKPYADEMYVLHLTSYNHGVVDRLIIELYDSIEQMGRDVLKAWSDVDNWDASKCVVCSRPTAAELYSTFL